MPDLPFLVFPMRFLTAIIVFAAFVCLLILVLLQTWVMQMSGVGEDVTVSRTTGSGMLTFIQKSFSSQSSDTSMTGRTFVSKDLGFSIWIPDHVFLSKGNSTSVGNGGGRIAFLYNTVIHVAKEYSGSTAAEIAAFDWSDDSIALPDAAVGSGLYAANNIIYDCPVLQRFYNAANHTVIFDNNILPVPWAGARGWDPAASAAAPTTSSSPPRTMLRSATGTTSSCL